MSKQISVVIALLRDETGRILISRRNDAYVPDAHDRWALVGGKIEYGENPEAALAREVKEETALEIDQPKLYRQIFTQLWKNHLGEEFQVILIPYECKVRKGSKIEHGIDPKIVEARFVGREDLKKYDFIPLDKEIIESLL